MTQQTSKRIKGLFAATPCFILAITLLRTWIDPMSVSDGAWVSYAMGIMVLEFVLAHSGLMMASYLGGAKKRGWMTVVLLTLVYCLFAAVIALAFKSWSLVIIFTTVMATRWHAFIFDSENAKKEAVARSIISLLLYMFAVIVTLFVPLPELGVTPEVADELSPKGSSGEWADRPHIALAAGILYFSLLGLTEFFSRFKAGSETEA